MKVRFIPLIAALVAGLSLVASSAAAPPASTSLQIQGKATSVTASQIVVRVAVTCPAGTTEQIQVQVSQQQTVGPNTNGGGVTNVLCDSSGQTVSVLVNGGPFTLGQAFATAVGISFELNQRAEDERVITIS
jgi:hypothetical protein